jgi:hypothetical protein
MRAAASRAHSIAPNYLTSRRSSDTHLLGARNYLTFSGKQALDPHFEIPGEGKQRQPERPASILKSPTENDSSKNQSFPVRIQFALLPNFSISRSNTSTVGPNFPRSIFESCPWLMPRHAASSSCSMCPRSSRMRDPIASKSANFLRPLIKKIPS